MMPGFVGTMKGTSERVSYTVSETMMCPSHRLECTDVVLKWSFRCNSLIVLKVGNPTMAGTLVVAIIVSISDGMISICDQEALGRSRS